MGTSNSRQQQRGSCGVRAPGKNLEVPLPRGEQARSVGSRVSGLPEGSFSGVDCLRMCLDVRACKETVERFVQHSRTI